MYLSHLQPPPGKGGKNRSGTNQNKERIAVPRKFKNKEELKNKSGGTFEVPPEKN
jgi:hypothetical protein